MVRLDAVGYTVKTAGTSCFLTPKTFEFVDELAAEARDLGLAVLAEVHAPHALRPRSAAGHVDRVYDFVLAPLVLHAVLTGDAAPLRRLAGAAAAEHRDRAGHPRRPRHDRRRARRPAAATGCCRPRRSRRSSRGSRTTAAARASPAASRAGSTRSAARCTTRWAATTGRSCWPGCCSCSPRAIPQVYYVGLLAGRNVAVPAAPTPGRSTAAATPTAEVDAALEQPVVAAAGAGAAAHARTRPSAGSSPCPDAPDGELVLAWRHGDATAELRADLARTSWRVAFSGAGAARTVTDADLDGRG